LILHGWTEVSPCEGSALLVDTSKGDLTIFSKFFIMVCDKIKLVLWDLSWYIVSRFD